MGVHVQHVFKCHTLNGVCLELILFKNVGGKLLLEKKFFFFS